MTAGVNCINVSRKMFENEGQNIALGLGVGVLIAEPIVYYLMKLLEVWGDCVAEERKSIRWKRHVVLHATGTLERLAYILLLVSNASAAGAFIGTWILAKVGTGWNLRQQLSKQDEEASIDKRSRRAFISLVGSLLSVLFSLLGVYLWRPEYFEFQF